MDDTVYKGNDWDDVRPHLWNFFQAVKSRKPVAEDAVFGNHAAIACHMANESYFRKKPVSGRGFGTTETQAGRSVRAGHVLLEMSLAEENMAACEAAAGRGPAPPYSFISRMLPFDVFSSIAGPPAPILPSR